MEQQKTNTTFRQVLFPPRSVKGTFICILRIECFHTLRLQFLLPYYLYYKSLVSFSSHTSPTFALFEFLPQNNKSFSQAWGGEKLERVFTWHSWWWWRTYLFVCFLSGPFFLSCSNSLNFQREETSIVSRADNWALVTRWPSHIGPLSGEFKKLSNLPLDMENNDWSFYRSIFRALNVLHICLHSLGSQGRSKYVRDDYSSSHFLQHGGINLRAPWCTDVGNPMCSKVPCSIFVNRLCYVLQGD